MSIVPGLVPLSIKEIPLKGKTIIVFIEVLKVGNETKFLIIQVKIIMLRRMTHL